MATSSLTITNLSLPPFHHNTNPYPKHYSLPTSRNLLKFKRIKTHLLPSHHTNLHISLFHPLPPNPTSKPPLPPFPSPPFLKKIASLLLGSLLLMGSFKTRPVLARPIQESQSLEENREAQVDKEEEEVMCEELVKENPKDVEALKMVVNVKMKRGKTKEGLEYVERLVELQPNEMEWRLLQALCYEMLGDLGKARSLFKSILKQRPLLLRALHGLAMVMHKNSEGPAVFQMLDGALQAARRERKVNEERNIRILAAQMHIVKGDVEVAMEQLQDLINENPRDFRPYLCQGIVYSLLDKKEEAEERFEIYRSLVPEEFPQRGFLDDVVLAAKTESRQQLQKQIQS